MQLEALYISETGFRFREQNINLSGHLLDCQAVFGAATEES